MFNTACHRVYRGFLVNGKPQFFGEEFGSRRRGEKFMLMYRGAFKDGVYEGKGSLYYKDRLVFLGFFSQGFPTSGTYLGKVIRDSNTKIRGDFTLEGAWTLAKVPPIPCGSAKNFLRCFKVKGVNTRKNALILHRYGDFTIDSDLGLITGAYKFIYKNGCIYEGNVEGHNKLGKGTYWFRREKG
jgi:hypothetical protein